MNTPLLPTHNQQYRDFQNLSKSLKSVSLIGSSTFPRMARKYFSKKVLDLLCFRNSSSREASVYRYKAVKTVRMYTASIRRSPLRSVKKIMICYPSQLNAINLNESDKKKALTFMNQISKYKELKSLEYYGNLSMTLFKPIKTLTNLEDLTLDLNIYHVSANFQTFLSLNTLKRFRLIVNPSLMGISKDVENQVFTFCRKLMTKINLQYVKLDLKNLRSAKDSDLIENLFTSLIDTKVPCFDILLDLSLLDCISHVNSIQTLLKAIDILELALDHADSDNFRISVNNKDPIESLFPYVSQPHKKLSLSFSTSQGRTQQPLLIQAQNSQLAKSLKILYPFIYFYRSCTRILDYLFIKNLKSLTFNLRSHQVVSELKILSEILKNSLHLNHLNLKKSFLRGPLNQDPIESKFLLDMISQLENLKHFESLILQDFEISDSVFNKISTNINTLSNLKKLQFNCFVYGANLVFSFGMLKNLSELQITLPELTAESQRSFIENLSQLSGLEILEIKQGHLLLRNSKVRLTLMKALCDLNKLKKVIIDSARQQIFFGLLAEKEIMFYCVRDDLKWLFDKNSSLEWLEIKNDDLYEIQYVRPR